jgi:hypothetical protein
VCAQGGIFSTNYQYLTAYKGLVFFTKASTPIQFQAGTEFITAKNIWIPG